MKGNFYIIVSIILINLSSCKKDESVTFGTVEYYPSFLWVDSKTTPVTKTFEFDFSQDAKDYNSYAEFQFVDNDGKPINTEIMQVFADGQQLKDNKLKIGSNVKSIDLTFKFRPNAENGKHQGYLKIIDHKLDRIDSQELCAGQQVDVFQWTLGFDKKMNPLAKFLMWMIIIIFIALAVWFLFIRPILYPHFGKFTKSLLIEKDNKIIAQMNYSFKGARKVVFSVRKEKQSFLNRIFTGEIKYLTNPVFVDKLTFSPRKKCAAVYGNGYIIKPNPIPKSGIATINNIQQKLVITIR